MLAFILTTICCFLVWLVLTASGSTWSYGELIAGGIFSIIVGALSRKIFIKNKDFRMANPIRWLKLIAYIGPFFWGMAKANLDVAYRIITGKINPGIVKISPGLKTDLGITLLANSITLTPGTLSVDVDEENNLYIHWINVKLEALEEMPRDYKYICGSFPKWAGRIAE